MAVIPFAEIRKLQKDTELQSRRLGDTEKHAENSLLELSEQNSHKIIKANTRLFG